MENGQPERGMQILRERGMLLDVPLLETSPIIDGRLDDSAWEQAITFDNFHQYGEHSAAYLSDVRTRGYVGYTWDAVYLGAHCFDAQSESLLVESHDPDNNISLQDLLQLCTYTPTLNRKALCTSASTAWERLQTPGTRAQTATIGMSRGRPMVKELPMWVKITGPSNTDWVWAQRSFPDPTRALCGA